MKITVKVNFLDKGRLGELLFSYSPIPRPKANDEIAIYLNTMSGEAKVYRPRKEKNNES